MRIIGGSLKGHVFKPSMKSWPTRPTTDIAKEGLFNILMNRIDFEETKMLDLFGGTGNHSWEFLSRGCLDVTYVDKFRGAVDFVKNQSDQFGFQNNITIIRQDVKRFIKSTDVKFDYIFAGPPYGLPWLDEIPGLIFDHHILEKEGLFVLEHNPTHRFDFHPRFIEQRNYGQTIFAFFS